MPHSFARTARLLVAAAIAAALPLGAASAATTPPGQQLRQAPAGVFAGISDADFDGPRCKNRRTMCRRYSTDARVIRCLERFGCFTGPSFE